jgi:hypothetical protein
MMKTSWELNCNQIDFKKKFEFQKGTLAVLQDAYDSNVSRVVLTSTFLIFLQI